MDFSVGGFLAVKSQEQIQEKITHKKRKVVANLREAQIEWISVLEAIQGGKVRKKFRKKSKK